MPEQAWAEVRERLAQAPFRQEAPAAVFLAWRPERDPVIFSAGRANPDTVFDLASLTKPLAAIVMLLYLMQYKRLTWATTLHELWGQGVPADKRAISIRQLAAHEAGFPAYEPYYQILADKPPALRLALLKAMLMNEPLAYEPGADTVYSDLGYMALGLILAEAGGLPLEALLAAAYAELDLGDNVPAYHPLEHGRQLSNIAPSGPLPGRPVIWGQVEDDNAWALGGAAGHAGLFGTARQVALVMDALLKVKAGQTVWESGLSRPLWQPSRAGGGRTAGFDLPGPAGAAGDLAPSGVVGHLGFTGVSFWWQVDSQAGLVLLTNRVALGRQSQGIKELRRQVHDLAWPVLRQELQAGPRH